MTNRMSKEQIDLLRSARLMTKKQEGDLAYLASPFRSWGGLLDGVAGGLLAGAMGAAVILGAVPQPWRAVGWGLLAVAAFAEALTIIGKVRKEPKP